MSYGDLLAKIERDIERDGWSTISVFGAEGGDEPPSPPFAYSIGFREHDHPEILVIGLEPVVAHSIIGALYHRVAAGELFEEGQIVEDVLGDDYLIRLDAVPTDGRPLNWAKAYYGVDELPALLAVWPDEKGWFPDSEHFDEKFEGVQDLEKVRVNAS